MSQHNRYCTKRLSVVSISPSHAVTISERAEVTNVFSPVTAFLWGERDGTLFTDDLNVAYEKIVLWRKNLFMLPTGNAGKKYIKDVTKLLNTWAQDSPLRSISLKAIHNMLALLLQKPSKTSKSRDHLDALERRLQLWERSEIKSLLLEAETTQRRLTANYDPKNIADVSKKFAKLIRKGNIIGA